MISSGIPFYGLVAQFNIGPTLAQTRSSLSIVYDNGPKPGVNGAGYSEV